MIIRDTMTKIVKAWRKRERQRKKEGRWVISEVQGKIVFVSWAEDSRLRRKYPISRIRIPGQAWRKRESTTWEFVVPEGSWPNAIVPHYRWPFIHLSLSLYKSYQKRESFFFYISFQVFRMRLQKSEYFSFDCFFLVERKQKNRMLPTSNCYVSQRNKLENLFQTFLS